MCFSCTVQLRPEASGGKFNFVQNILFSCCSIVEDRLTQLESLTKKFQERFSLQSTDKVFVETKQQYIQYYSTGGEKRRQTEELIVTN